MRYFDYAAATPVDPAVRQAMEPYFSELFFNPSATYLPGKRVRQDVAQARGRVAAWLGVPANEVFFTAGGTEANNLALQGIMGAFPDGHVVVGATEHDSVLMPAANFNHSVAAVDAYGIVNLHDLAAAITDQTVLVSIMYVNNEIGTIQPLRKIGQLLADIRKQRQQTGNARPLYLHTDACQAGNYLDLHVSRLSVDMMTLNGGKLYGPKQSGALYCGHQVRLRPLLYGGGQERGQRSGTENVPGIIGFTAALDSAQALRSKEAVRLSRLQKQAFDLLTAKIPDVIVNGSLKHRIPNNIHITIPNTDNERLLLQLEAAGILAAAGSACSASNDQPSHVLRAIGCSDAAARSSLRITMGRATTETDIQELAQSIVKITTK